MNANMGPENDRIVRLTARPRALQWLLGSAALVIALVAYCELCSLVYGEPGVGLRASGAWALQTSIGWMLVGAAIGAFGPRISGAKIAREHPYALAASMVLAVAIFTVACEALITYLRQDAPFAGSRDSILALIYARTPVSVLASALVIGGWTANWTRRREKASGAGPASVNGSEVEPASASRGAADVIDVMTGTGRATIRIGEIECFRADRNYITITHTSGRSYLLRQTMASLERSLDPERFRRIHRSIIVNRDMVIERRRGGVLVLRSGRTVQSSRKGRKRRE